MRQKKIIITNNNNKINLSVSSLYEPFISKPYTRRVLGYKTSFSNKQLPFLGENTSTFIAISRPTPPTPQLNNLVRYSQNHLLKFKDFTLFERSLKKIFLSTRIDRHRAVYNNLKKELLSGDSGASIIGYKCIIKGKLSSGGNSRKKKITLSVPLVYPSGHL